MILLVEDNPDNRDLALLALRETHIVDEIHTCNDGEEALDFLFGPRAADDARALPLLVLLDLKLPKVDGFEVLKRIRAHDRTRLLPVVVLTTSTEEKDLLECYRLGANSCVRKSVDFTKFSEAAQRLAYYWLIINEKPPPCV